MFTFQLSVARLPRPILEDGADIAYMNLFGVSRRHSFHAGYKSEDWAPLEFFNGGRPV